MPYCRKCGNPIDDAQTFCSRCGVAVERTENTVTQAEPVVSQVQQVTGYAPDTSPAPAPSPVYTAPAPDPLQKCLDKFHKRLGYEKTAYLVIAILQTVGAVFLLFAGLAIVSMGALVGNRIDYDNYYNSGYRYTSASHTEAVDFWDDYDFDYYDDYYDYDYDYDDDYDYNDGYGHGYDYGYDDEAIAQAAISVIGGVYIFLGLIRLAGAIINYVQVARISRFRNEMYTDCTGAIRFCRSVGVIVLGVFFGIIPMIFHIVNRVFVIDHDELLEEIKNRQNVNTVHLN